MSATWPPTTTGPLPHVRAQHRVATRAARAVQNALTGAMVGGPLLLGLLMLVGAL